MVMKPKKEPKAPPKAPDGAEAASEIEAPAAEAAAAPAEGGEDQPTLDEALARIKAAEAERDEAKTRAETAEATARKATATVANAETERASAELTAVTNGIATLKSSQATLKTALRDARANGDVDAEFDILDKIAGVAHDLKVLEHGKANMEAAAKAPKRPNDPVEATAAAMERDGSVRSAAFIRAHPEYITNPRLNAKMILAHEEAKAEGLTIDSPEYVTSIEIALGLKQSDGTATVTKKADGDEMPEAAAAASGGRRAAPPPAAPPSRGSNGNRVTLSVEEREMAEMNFPDVPKEEAYKQYAKNKAELQAEGKLGQTQH